MQSMVVFSQTHGDEVGLLKRIQTTMPAGAGKVRLQQSKMGCCGRRLPWK